ncbi:hypothetical protein QR98_0034560 [Sarcoptes scabiei]|uniref:Uncharacterized protein n=1 Tax=Sarcoptes scabiei TaxID=52283 RepID=A0A132A1S1_SARSC|nr:hypothetical protein QR98_0034560 [Sarcoptes scabiei]
MIGSLGLCPSKNRRGKKSVAHFNFVVRGGQRANKNKFEVRRISSSRKFGYRFKTWGVGG